MEDFDIERIATEATVAHETKVRQTYRAGIMKLADGNDLSAKEGDAFYAAAKELGVAPPAIAEHVATIKTAATYRHEVERERELTAANHKRLIELATAIKEAEAKLQNLQREKRVREHENAVAVMKANQSNNLHMANPLLFGDIDALARQAVEKQADNHRRRAVPMAASSFRS